jgi:hypothetical protein
MSSSSRPPAQEGDSLSRTVDTPGRRVDSQDTAGKKVSASFLYNATRSTFEQVGFTYDRPKGKNHCIMHTTVPSRPAG